MSIELDGFVRHEGSPPVRTYDANSRSGRMLCRAPRRRDIDAPAGAHAGHFATAAMGTSARHRRQRLYRIVSRQRYDVRHRWSVNQFTFGCGRLPCSAAPCTHLTMSNQTHLADSLPVPAARRARVLIVFFIRPDQEGRRSADRRPDAAASGGRAMTRHAGRLRSALCVPCAGRRASRRSTLALLRCGSALPSLGISSGDVQRAPRGRVVVPGGRLPHLPSLRLRAAAAGRQSRSAFGIASRKRPS